MKKHRDLITVLRSNGMRITPGRRVLLQYLLDRKSQPVSLREIADHLDRRLPGVDRSSVYRNLEALKKLDILQEMTVPSVGRRYQFVFERKLHPYFICKACGRLNRGKEKLFRRVDRALRQVPGFPKANLSVVFYGRCDRCG